MINKDLLDILACPQCKGAVKLQNDHGIVCEKCKLLYEIKDDIPVMLVDKAKSLEQQSVTGRRILWFVKRQGKAVPDRYFLKVLRGLTDEYFGRKKQIVL